MFDLLKRQKRPHAPSRAGAIRGAILAWAGRHLRFVSTRGRMCSCEVHCREGGDAATRMYRQKRGSIPDARLWPNWCAPQLLPSRIAAVFSRTDYALAGTVPLCSANNRCALVSALLLANDHALAVAIEYSWCKPPKTDFTSTSAPPADNSSVNKSSIPACRTW